MQNTMDEILVKYTGGQMPVCQFLKLAAHKLTPFEKEIQQSLQKLYTLNEKEHLFGKFPDWRLDKPLTISCLDCPAKHEGGFHQARNVIEFGSKGKDIYLQVLAHELKHAEQCDLYMYERTMGRPYRQLKQEGKIDAMGMHQLNYLMEAQAFAFDQYVQGLDLKYFKPGHCKLLPITQKYLTPDKMKSFQEFEKDFIVELLPLLYKKETYKDYNDFIDTITDSDRGIDMVPPVFGLDESYVQKRLMPILRQVPREARLPQLKIRQKQKNESLLGTSQIPPKKQISHTHIVERVSKGKSVVGRKTAPKNTSLNVLLRALSQEVGSLAKEVRLCQKEISTLHLQQFQTRRFLNRDKNQK